MPKGCVFATSLATVCPLYVQPAERTGRAKEEKEP